jgi:hypothetical protein
MALLGAATLLALASSAPASTIRLINRDGPNEGFNDATPRAPVGGNQGTTIGEQRLIVFQRAIDMWAARLESPIEIRVGAKFDPLECNGSSVVLGMAGPTIVHINFAGAPLPDTWYPAALADSFTGLDMDPADDDIEAQFSSVFGTTCAFPAGWYYGLDGAPPGEDSDLLTVVLHELGHGLGFISLVDIHDGSRLADDFGVEHDDVFMSFLVDDRSGKSFSDMSNGERRSAIVATEHLKWEGAEVVGASDRLLAGTDESGRVEMYAPSDPLDGSSLSHWSDDVYPNELMEPFLNEPVHDLGLAVELLLDLGWTAPALPECRADCDDSGSVTINELVSSVNIALGTIALASCPAADADDSGTVGVNELIAAVVSALDGCE